MIRRIDYSKVLFISAGPAFGGVTFFVHPFNHDALGFIVTAFSILAGIMIAVIAMLGDPARLYRGSWRTASAQRRQIRRRLYLYEMLFYAYLIVIGLACAAAVIDKMMWPGVRQWVARIALGAGVAAFVWSLSLPHAIIRTQMARLDEEVDRRRARTSADNSNSNDISSN